MKTLTLKLSVLFLVFAQVAHAKPLRTQDRDSERAQELAREYDRLADSINSQISSFSEYENDEVRKGHGPKGKSYLALKAKQKELAIQIREATDLLRSSPIHQFSVTCKKDYSYKIKGSLFTADKVSHGSIEASSIVTVASPLMTLQLPPHYNSMYPAPIEQPDGWQAYGKTGRDWLRFDDAEPPYPWVEYAEACQTTCQKVKAYWDSKKATLLSPHIEDDFGDTEYCQISPKATGKRLADLQEVVNAHWKISSERRELLREQDADKHLAAYFSEIERKREALAQERRLNPEPPQQPQYIRRGEGGGDLPPHNTHWMGTNPLLPWNWRH